MAKYLIQDATMQAIADPIKEMSGATSKLVPSQIATAAEEANTEVGTQANMMEQILTALNGKGTGSGTTIPDGYIDTSDATATASDARKGSTFYANGKKVTGTLPEYGIVMATNLTPKAGSSSISLSSTRDEDAIILAGTEMSFSAEYSEFGDATAADVAAGKTFTSAAGLLVKGTKEETESATLPTLTNPGTASDLASGKELIDGSGNIVTGTHECANGLIVKSGTTTSATIDVGLSILEYFAIYKTEAVQETGLISGIYRADAATAYRAAVCGCSSYSTYSSKVSHSEGNSSWLSFDSGTVTLSTSQTYTALSSGETYKWIAFGAE